jgi:enoyl-CoA hydratase/carnithine racemase
MAEYKFCKVEDEGRVRIVTINRPEVLNALHSEAHWEFDGIWNEFAADPELWVGIITGAGGCDIVVAAEAAVFALPEPRVGLIAGSGVHRLPRMIGQKNALGMILTGRRVSAAEGKELGFVNEVVPAGQALEAAKRWAGLILECSPMAIRASKQSVYKSLDEPTLQAAMTTTYPAVQANLDSEDYIEGPKAFAERRKPNWRNR